MSFEKIVLGTFNQASDEFGESAGKQCTCCSLYSIVFTRLIKRPGHLNKFDIIFIVRQGYLVYKSLKTDEQIMYNCMSLIPRKNAIFLFDSHSRNILGQPIPDGFSIFIKFKTKNDAEKYI